MATKSATSRVTAAIHATRARMSLRPLKRVSGAPDRSGLLFASLGTNASLRGVFMVALYHPERVALCHPECVALCHPERVALCLPERSEGSIRGTTASLKARTTLKERYQPSLLSSNYHITFPPKEYAINTW